MRNSILNIRTAGALALILCGASARAADESAPAATPHEVIAGLQAFWAKTALPDGSFRPGVDPDYRGMSDSALSDMAPLTYAVILHKTFGLTLADEPKTTANLLARQKEDGAFYHVRGTGDPQAPLTRVYNTTQGLVALHALGVKPKYDPLPVFERTLDGDYKKLPLYTTSFFPLAYACLGKPFPAEQDQKMRALMPQADDGYLDDHVATTFHLVHYYRLIGAAVPKADAIVARTLHDQKPDGSWMLNPLARDRHAAFDAVFCLAQLDGDKPEVKKAIDRAAAWALSCRNGDGGFGHYPGSPSDADATYFQVGILVMAGFLKPADPPPKDPQLLSWGHLFPRP
ncbi:MAG TPA: prenyltransferase/squalene oxidase repeat-containing protein [Gemmataceae bacterium]|nr:prenyltransferase/squalene oxidase repeat-containing protein [Gemmataceae bacterium]